MSRKNVLLKETDIRKHLTHHYNIDPNKIIFEEFLRLYGKDYAEKFLAYRRDFEAVKKGRVIMPTRLH